MLSWGRHLAMWANMSIHMRLVVALVPGHAQPTVLVAYYPDSGQQ